LGLPLGHLSLGLGHLPLCLLQRLTCLRAALRRRFLPAGGLSRSCLVCSLGSAIQGLSGLLLGLACLGLTALAALLLRLPHGSLGLLPGLPAEPLAVPVVLAASAGPGD